MSFTGISTILTSHPSSVSAFARLKISRSSSSTSPGASSPFSTFSFVRFRSNPFSNRFLSSSSFASSLDRRGLRLRLSARLGEVLVVVHGVSEVLADRCLVVTRACSWSLYLGILSPMVVSSLPLGKIN